ncbi:Hemolysin-type calcium-binding region [Nitrosomonas sp. Is79A3]|uniref:DUF4347 domain-containing protein n=1 Tax=Nitrosomonas sp. (strain Is79A3) TaxID=261292 RepID=UPI000215C7A5
MTSRIVFIDSNIAEYQSLIPQLPSDSQVIVLDANKDGVLQILTALQGESEFNAIDIISHGKPGTLLLGSIELNNVNLTDYAEQLTEIGAHLCIDSDILLYGCEVAQGKTGQAFIDQLAQLTGANVAASTNLTGAADLGGDWVLEAQAGMTQAPTLQLSYHGVLAILTGTTGNDVLNGSTGDDTFTGGLGDDTLNGGTGNDIAIFSGNEADYRFSRNSSGHITVKDMNTANGDEGTDTLLNIETARFSDGDIGTSFEKNGEFGVNTYYSYGNTPAAITGLSNGGFVVSWYSNPQDGSLSSISAQLYDANGVPQGGEFSVGNAYSGYLYPTITALNNGGFVIAWDFPGAETANDGIHARIYDANGIAHASEFIVNTNTGGYQGNPSIATLSDGGFVVSWSSTSNYSPDEINAQRYDANGVPQGSEFKVDTYTAIDQMDGEWWPSITALTNGGFVVSWTSYNQDGRYGYDIYAQRYDASGAAQGGEFMVSTTTTGGGLDSSMTALTDGGFVVTWSIPFSPGGIYAQRYDSNGVALGSQFQVGSDTFVYGSRSSITTLTNGGFVVAWESTDPEDGSRSIYAQRYDADGIAQGSGFRVNTYLIDTQEWPSITSLADGGFVITWIDGNRGGIFAQRYDSEGKAVGGDLTLTGSANDDHLTVASTLTEPVYLLGMAGNDVLQGAKGNDNLDGGTGNDTINGGIGADTMIGGLGNDNFTVDNVGDVIIEKPAEGTDKVNSSVSYYTLPAKVENLTLTGTAAINGAGNDLANSLTGNAAINVLTGGAGNDTLNGGAGADSLIGGLGDDTYTIDNAGDAVTENLGEGTDKVNSSVTYTLSANVENLTLTGALAIDGTGNDLANSLTGNTAINVLIGGAGNDILNGGAGADSLIGGLGNDTYTVDNAGDVVTENLGEGTDKINSSVTYTLSTNVENLTLTGSSAINGTGNDLVNNVTGNTADNQLNGEAGNDTLNGGTGNDMLTGGTGKDTMTGGTGSDIFRFIAKDSIDKIVDYNAADDTIQLEDSIFTALTTIGTLAANNFIIGTSAADSNDFIVYNSATGALLYDADGNGVIAAVQIATLTSGLALTNADFVVI